MKERDHIYHSENGIALMLVMMSIALLTAIMVTFTFDTKVNKIKAINLQEKAQARLNAEAGLHLAVTRLALYAEAFNKREQTEGADEMVSNQMINQIWQFPFAFPIPDIPGLTESAKSSIETFNTDNFLEGQMSLSIKNISNQYNLNALHINSTLLFDQEGKDQSEKMYTAKNNLIDFYVDQVSKKLLDIANNDPELQTEADERNQDVAKLFDQVMFFTSEDGLADQLFRIGSPAIDFADRKLERKFGPLSSKSELALLPAWDDFILEYVADLFTVHNNIAPDETGRSVVNSVIDLNTLEEKHLITLFDMLPDQAKDFIEQKNDPTLPVFFKSSEDFITFASDTTGLISRDLIAEKFDQLKQMGILFETYPSLFEVTSSGIVGRTRYTIKAYITTPVQVPPPAQTPQELCLQDEEAQWVEENSPPCICPEGKTLVNNRCVEGDQAATEDEQSDQTQQTEQKTQLLPPVILEVFLT